MKDLVSICIPSYNHAAYLTNCLDSILKETYKNIELIIIDDGSTDNSVDVIRIWHQSNSHIRLKLLVQENKGLNYTLNRLITVANGKYICFLSSDDALCNDGIKKRVEFLRNQPTKLVVIGDAMVIDNNNKITHRSAIEDLYNGVRANYLTDEGLKYSVVNEFSIPGSNLLVEKRIYQIIGKYPALFAEDIYFYLRVIGLNLLVYLDEPVSLYRVHDNNTCGNIKYRKQLNSTFIYSYWNNLFLFQGRNRLVLLRKLLGRIKQRFLLNLHAVS